MADILFRVPHQALIHVTDQQILKRLAQEVDGDAFTAFQLASHDPRLVHNVSELVLSSCVTRDALQILLAPSDELLECHISQPDNGAPHPAWDADHAIGRPEVIGLTAPRGRRATIHRISIDVRWT